MATLLSPGVAVSTNDLSQVTTATGDSAACFSGDFVQGPVNVPTLITSVAELKSTFGGPTKSNYNQWYQCYNFLQYSSELYITRAADINGTPTETDLVYNSNAFVGRTTESAKDVSVDSVDDKTLIVTPGADEITANENLRFGDSSEIFKVVSAEKKTQQIKNPAYVPLTQLDVVINKLSLVDGAKIPFSYETDGELSFEVNPTDLVTIDPTNKTISANKAGTGYIIVSAKKEGSREKKLRYDFEISEFKLSASPAAISLNVGAEQEITINATTGAKTTLALKEPTDVILFENNKVTALKEGNANLVLSATLDDVSKEVIIPVEVIAAGETEAPTLGSTISPILIGAETTITFNTTEATDTIVATATGGTATVEGKNVKFSAAAEGEYTISVKAVRNGVESAALEVKIEVVEKPDAPILASTFDNVEINSVTDLDFTLENADDILTANPTYGNATVSGAKVTYTAGDIPGNYSLKTYATRKGFKSAETTTNFVIRPIKPVLASSDTEVVENKSLNLDFTISAGDTLTATATNGTVSVSGSKVTYTAGNQGTGTVTVKATKNSIESDSLEVSITVTADPNLIIDPASISELVGGSTGKIIVDIPDGSTLEASVTNGGGTVNVD